MLIFILNTLEVRQWLNDDPAKSVYELHFIEDMEFCHTCFDGQVKKCATFIQDLTIHNVGGMEHLLSLLPQRICKRQNQLLKWSPGNQTEIVMAKYFGRSKKEVFLNIQNWTETELETYFLKRNSLDGMQLYPKNAIVNFIKAIQSASILQMPEKTIWLYILTNVQLAIMPVLYEYNFPVPKTFACCGFSLFQQYAGQNLNSLFNSDFQTKLHIAEQLLELALKFSYGLNNYRFYITDLTGDNLVYDSVLNSLKLVDLDTLFVVDALYAAHKSKIHRHEYIGCEGCFAYSPDDISAFNLSDINIYSACQLLREDLYKDKSKGFLYSVTKDLPGHYGNDLNLLLDKCVDCPVESCVQRFEVAKEFIKFITKIINLN